jgi:hypothetical protein
LIKDGMEGSLRMSHLRQIDGMSTYVNTSSEYKSYFLQEEIIRYQHLDSGKKRVDAAAVVYKKRKRHIHPTIALFECKHTGPDTLYTPLSNASKRARKQCAGCKQTVRNGAIECVICDRKCVFTCTYCHTQHSISFDVCQSCRILR